MARARRTFYTARRRTVKWSPHLLEQQLSITANPGDFGSYQLLAKNTSDNTTPTPSVIKVKNFKVSIDTTLPTVDISLMYFNAYVIFIPEGVTITPDTPKQHPEWILAWKSINNVMHTQRDCTVLTSRLARNLNSGDAVYVLFTGNKAGSTATITLNVVSSYVTRAN